MKTTQLLKISPETVSTETKVAVFIEILLYLHHKYSDVNVPSTEIEWGLFGYQSDFLIIETHRNTVELR